MEHLVDFLCSGRYSSIIPLASGLQNPLTMYPSIIDTVLRSQLLVKKYV